MFEKYTYRGRHRAPTAPGRAAAKVAVTGAVAALPAAAVAPAAHAAPDSVWDKLAECESSGNWSINTGNGYSGGLQFHPQTWRGFGGAEFATFAHLATRAEQIVVAERVLDAQGWGAWPACSSKLGIRGTGVDLRDAPAAKPAPAKPAAKPAPRAAAKPEPRAAKPAPRKAAVDPQPAQRASSGAYTVVAGDTLSEIAAAHGTTWPALYERNRAVVGGNPHLIFPGARLNV